MFRLSGEMTEQTLTADVLDVGVLVVVAAVKCGEPDIPGIGGLGCPIGGMNGGRANGGIGGGIPKGCIGRGGNVGGNPRPGNTGGAPGVCLKMEVEI